MDIKEVVIKDFSTFFKVYLCKCCNKQNNACASLYNIPIVTIRTNIYLFYKKHGFSAETAKIIAFSAENPYILCTFAAELTKNAHLL